jgi:predicted transcriptional regulator of viral defense system
VTISAAFRTVGSMNVSTVVDDLASNQGGVVARHQLLDSGIAPSTLRRSIERGALEVVCRGVFRLPGSPRSEEQRLWAAHLRVGSESVVAHGSAARLWGLKSIEQCRPTLVVPHRLSPRVGSGMIVHRTRRLDEPDIGDVNGLPVTQPARTLVDLSAETGKARLTAALEEAHYNKLVGYLEVGRTLLRLGEPGRRGAVLLGELLDARTSGRNLEQSVLERLLSELFEAAGITEVIRQNPLQSHGGVDGLVDAFLPRGAVIAEGDGRRWHSRCADMVKDRQRDLAAAEVGIQTVRFMHEQLTSDLAGCAAQLRNTVELRASQGLGMNATGNRLGR